MTMKKNKVAHNRVASICHEIAREIYEQNAKNNEFFRLNGDADLFVRNVAPYVRPIARRILATMMRDPLVTEEHKRELYDAFMLDGVIGETADLN